MLTLAFEGGKTPAFESGRKVNEWVDDADGAFARAFFWEGLYWIDWLGLGAFAFSNCSRAVKVWPQTAVEHTAIADTFSCMIQPIIMQALGWQTLHAGAAAGPGGVVAFCGRSGSGKSTLAFAMQQLGWRQFADDALVLRLDNDRVTACQLPFRPRLRPPSRAHFARACVEFSPAPQPAELPLKAAFLLRQDARLPSPRIALLPPARAFSELLAHGHCLEPDDPVQTRRLARDYLTIAGCVPVFTLAYRPDFEDFRQLTEGIVASAVAVGAAAPFSDQSHLAASPL